VYDRVADKKAAIGYTYEDSSSAAVDIGSNNIDDDASSDEDIDLGQLTFCSTVLSMSCTGKCY